MTDYDPNTPLETKEDFDRYIQFCAASYAEMGDATPRTHLTAHRAASWQWVVAAGQLHLDDDELEIGEQHRPTLMGNIAEGFKRARRVERGDPGVTLRELWVTRAVFDCWEPKGRLARYLLEAGKCAVSAIIVIESHPVIDKWEWPAPDAWALVLAAGGQYDELDEYPDPWTPGDFAVVPSRDTMEKMKMQKVNQISERLQGPPPSMN